MDTPPTAKNWRLNAAAIIMDAEGCVLLGKDSGRNPYWHFPQGGVIKHESIEQTLAREVWEEVGLRPTEYTIVSRLPGAYAAGARSIVAGSAVFYGNIYQNVCALRSEKAKP